MIASVLKELLKETFDATIAKKGTINFSKTTLNDPHVKKVLAHVSKVLNVPESKLIDEIKEAEAKYKDIEKKAPILYGTIVQNIIENEVFSLLKKLEHGQRLENAPEFRNSIFLQLIRFIKAEHDQFFPLRNFIDHKYLKNERIILIPSNKKEDQHLNNIPTACATAKGEFAFNIKFMQELIDFAFVKGLKGKGKKWKSNGGPIPDEYVYIEFLIIHEFMHFSYADFHYHKIYKVSNKIINWVGDFRTNYLLVKSGYHQLPMGLFNDDINYDRQKSYKEMIDVVKSEFDKLNKDEQDKVSDRIDGMGDEHGEPGEPGEGEGEEGKGKGKPGDGDGDGPSEQDVEDRNKEIEGKMGEKKDKGGDELKPDESKEGKGNTKAERGGSDDTGKNSAGSKFDYTQVKPTYSWQQLLKKLLSDVTTETEETYQKPNKRNSRNLDIARQTGAGAVKPGEINSDLKKVKICFIVDSSGSMTSAIAKVFANIEQLFKKNKQMLNSDFYLIKFSSTHAIYRCNFGQGVYTEEAELFSKGGDAKKASLKELFTHHFGDSTNFNTKLVNDLEILNNKNYNLILFTDTDIIGGSNQANFFKLYGKTKKNLYVLADSKATYHAMLQAMKQIAKNITYIDD